MRDYSEQILTGEGKDDYARYMRTDDLLSLQRRPEDVVHRDELLFQVVHQSTELWLKLACSELQEATGLIGAGELDAAIELLRRASFGVELVTEQLNMMRFLSPWDFQTMRTILGHGSGADSPGWRSVQRHGRQLDSALAVLIEERKLDLAELYRSGTNSAEHRLVEAMIAWDEQVSLWRVRHFKMMTRIIGHDVIGTQGTPVDVLAKLIEYKFFPTLWRVRTELTDTGPMGKYHLAESV
ncbi:tryptophan 2,3-dioxygenase [Streptomyces antnestii]|uniref:Tryptophan 2,3-dioxygenase n=1 Tax=Streptomyces antnestii TaxID=2494256 RepID=A0A3S2WJ36_9ACTN|nr:tryptophan 2,3-dioxygenase family protein [Streptomyces sp. San01]RVU23850.1 tryptophan 2,3-dioxygenase [Streptomyces sp. San01]